MVRAPVHVDAGLPATRLRVAAGEPGIRVVADLGLLRPDQLFALRLAARKVLRATNEFIRVFGEAEEP